MIQINTYPLKSSKLIDISVAVTRVGTKISENMQFKLYS